VECLTDSGEFIAVYNFHVTDHATYFVGGDDWGFSVWAHNGGGSSCASPNGFGSIAFGNKMHLRFNAYLRKRYKGTRFNFFTRPGQTGPDAVVVGGTKRRFTRAELKPNTTWGIDRFIAQEGRWGPTMLFLYDAAGNIFPWI
jgi:hypothetical protein